MFRAVRRSSSGAPTVFAASGLHTHVVTGRSQVWVGNESEFPLRLDYERSPHAYVNQRLQIQLGLLMMSDVPLEKCWAFNVLWNNKFRYQVASCWLLLLRRVITYSNIYPTRCNVTQFILSGNCSTRFGWYLHPLSGAHTTVSTASGICHAVTVTCRYRGRVGTSLSVLWVAYATVSML